MRGDHPKASAPVKVRRMMSKLQAVVDRGILEEEPDGVLYLSAKARAVIVYIEGDADIMAALESKATDEEDKRIGFWTLFFMEYCGEASSEEIADGVHTLVGWHQAAEENRLNEWSMKLRLGEGKR